MYKLTATFQRKASLPSFLVQPRYSVYLLSEYKLTATFQRQAAKMLRDMNGEIATLAKDLEDKTQEAGSILALLVQKYINLLY